MRRPWQTMLGIAGLLISIAPLHAATLIPVIPVPGSVENSTGVIGINDNNLIAGGYNTDDGVEHGFFGTLDGNYTTFDYGTGGTEARAIDNAGNITGFSNSQSADHCSFIEFKRFADGMIVHIQKNHTPLNGIVQQMNSHGVFVGDWCNAAEGKIEGYYGNMGKYKAPLTIGIDTPYTAPRGIDKSGTVVGFWYDASSNQEGFLLQNGITGVINYPDPSAVQTNLEGINNKGIAVGQWTPGQWTEGVHAFAVDTLSGTFAMIEIPGATSSGAWGVNNAGLVAVNSDIGSFIYCPKRKSKCPGNGQTVADGTPIRVPAGTFLHYDVHTSARAKTLPRLPGHSITP